MGAEELCFEDLKVGQKFVSTVGRTVLDADNLWFSLLTLNTNQIHFNQEYARLNLTEEPFQGRMVVNGIFTLGLVVGLTVNATRIRGVMVGLEDVRFRHPVFAGDTIYAEAEVVDIRESKSHRDYGVVKFYTVGHNQRGDAVISFRRIVLVRKKKASGG